MKNDFVDPSPDWIVGVSGLELCLDSCTWIEHKELNLYPYDAGTDNGITYLVKKNSFLKRPKFYFTNFVRYNYFHKNILQTFSWSISGCIRFSSIVANEWKRKAAADKKQITKRNEKLQMTGKDE